MLILFVLFFFIFLFSYLIYYEYFIGGGDPSEIFLWSMGLLAMCFHFLIFVALVVVEAILEEFNSLRKELTEMIDAVQNDEKNIN